MVSTAKPRASLTTQINDNSTRDVSPAKVRTMFNQILDVLDRVDNHRNILDHGAMLDGFTDDTAAWNEALLDQQIIYFPEGRSYITGPLNFPHWEGVQIVGAGRNRSILVVDGFFDMNAPAVVQFNGAFQGLKDITIEFQQTATTDRASLRKYPVAIDLNGQSRADLSSLRINGGYEGIRAVGNCGGAVIDDIQAGCIKRGMFIDGALDSIRINRYHHWPFGFAHDIGLTNIYGDGQTVSLEIGRCDDLNISSILSYQARIIFGDYGLGGAFGVGSNITLDSNYGRLEFNAGEMALSSVYGSTAVPDDFIIAQTGGQLIIAGLALESGDLINHPQVRVSGASSLFVASDIISTVISPGTQAFLQQGGTMMITNGFINATVGQTRTRPLIEVAAGRSTITNMRSNDKGAGAGVFIKVTQDDWHNITGNVGPGYSYDFPAVRSTGLYSPNRPATA